MAVTLSCFNLLIPRTLIESRYPGDWQLWVKNYYTSHSDRIDFDDELFRISSMNNMDLEILLIECSGLGFKLLKTLDHATQWHEICVVQSMMSEPTLPCDWVEIIDNAAIYKRMTK